MTAGVDTATTQLAGSSDNPPAPAAIALSVISAKRSVGLVSKIGTTRERKPSRELNSSMAASRRLAGTGLRRVF